MTSDDAMAEAVVRGLGRPPVCTCPVEYTMQSRWHDDAYGRFLVCTLCEGMVSELLTNFDGTLTLTPTRHQSD